MEFFVRIQGRKIFKRNACLCDARFVEVHGLDPEKRKEALAFFRRTCLSVNGIACFKIEEPDLTGRNVDVVRSGEIAVLRRAEESVAVRKDFKSAGSENDSAVFRVRLQYDEYEFLLFHRSKIVIVESVFQGKFAELGHAHRCKIINKKSWF